MDPDKIQALLDFISKSGLDEVKIETEELTLKVKKSTPPKIHQNIIQSPGVTMPHDSTGLVAPYMPSPAAEPASPHQEEKAPAEANKNHKTIKSPMIGTFYQSPNPESPAFVKVGDKISAGKTVCVIEAMKLFNEIESEISGTVVEILVEDASPVEFDQPLFLVDPA